MGNLKGIAAYKQTSSFNEANLIRDHMDLVKRAVYSIAKNLPNYIEEDDLIQVGYIGLVKAAKNFTGENGAKFSTYAYYRIRGSIYDEIRSSDWKPRRSQKRTKLITTAILELEGSGNHHPTDSDISKKLEISLEEYYEWVKQTSFCKIVPMSNEDGECLDIEDKRKSYSDFEAQELQVIIKEALIQLPTDHAQIVSLHYLEELSFKDISFVMDMTAVKCARIFKKSLLILRAQMESKGYTHG